MPNHNPAGCAFAFRQLRADQLYPELEQTPDLSRGEQRLAAEVSLAMLRCRDVPTFAHERAVAILKILATG